MPGDAGCPVPRHGARVCEVSVVASWRATVASCAVVGVIVASGGAAAAAGPAASGVGGRGAGAVRGSEWGKAIVVPGTRSLNAGVGLDSMSCASPGDCTAAGVYGHYNHGIYVVSQVRGIWRRAVELPGLAALNKHRAGVGGVSCASGGNCSMGGSYTDGAGHGQAFVASQVRQRWRRAVEAPGTAALNTGGSAGIGPISCASPGNCTAGGSYRSGAGLQAFVISQVRGAWAKAVPVPGLEALNIGGTAGITSISCASPGNCTAAGFYRDAGRNVQAFAVSQVNGIWGQAIEVPGTAGLNTGGYAAVSAVSCGSPGNCSAVGNYGDSVGLEYPFVASQVKGTWRTATKIPGMTALNSYGAGVGYAISCGPAGDCVAAGSEGPSNGYDYGGGGKPFVVTEANGTWGRARHLPGMKRLNTGSDGAVTSVSCPAPGSCSAAGYYGVGTPGDRVYNLEVFVVSESRGSWGHASEIPGTAALNKGKWATVGALSCAAPGKCSVGGGYIGGSDHGEAFVDTSSGRP